MQSTTQLKPFARFHAGPALSGEDPAKPAAQLYSELDHRFGLVDFPAFAQPASGFVKSGE